MSGALLDVLGKGRQATWQVNNAAACRWEPLLLRLPNKFDALSKRASMRYASASVKRLAVVQARTAAAPTPPMASRKGACCQMSWDTPCTAPASTARQ